MSQEPQLFDTIWILQEITIDDTTINPPSNAINELYFNNDNSQDTIEITQVSCVGGIFVINIESYNSNISFIASSIGFPFDDECPNPQQAMYLFFHGSFYGDFNTGVTTNPFEYEITTIDNSIQLTITNGNGDIAIYGDEALSVADNDNTQIQTNYDAAQKKILVTGLTQNASATIYNLSGQLEIWYNISSNAAIPVNLLSNGIYFVNIVQGNKRSMTYKFVKY